MYSVTKQTLLEDVFPPKKLLYLCDAPMTDTADAITDCIGTALASYPSASPNYMKEVALVWARSQRTPKNRGTPRTPGMPIRRTASSASGTRPRFSGRFRA